VLSFIAGPPQGPYAFVAVVSPSVVRPSVHFPYTRSSGQISLTKQDRPTVTIEHYLEVGTADSVAAFRSLPDANWDIFRFFRYVQNISILRPVRLVVRPQLLSIECDRWNCR